MVKLVMNQAGVDGNGCGTIVRIRGARNVARHLIVLPRGKIERGTEWRHSR